MKMLSFRRLPATPASCLLCHALCPPSTAERLCGGCLRDLQQLAVRTEDVCPRCAGVSSGGAVCGQCQQKAPPFDALWTSVYYQPPVSGVLHSFKHLRDISLAAPLAVLMKSLPPPWLAEQDFDWVLAMPLSRERRLFRGFNQCEELLRLLAADFAWRPVPQSAVYRRFAPPQSTLAAEERRRNVRGIFEAVGNFNNCKVLLIDDVTTSGATLGELSRTLKKAGACSVFAWTLASAKMKKF